MPSLRRRLLTGTALGTAACLSAAGLTLYLLMRASLQAEFDAALRDKIATLSAMIELFDDEVDLEFTDAEMVEFRRETRPEYFQVWSLDGHVVGRSPSLGDYDLPRGEPASVQSGILTADLPDGRPGRLLTIEFTTRIDEEDDEDDDEPPDPPQQLTITLARDLVDIERTLARLRFVLLLVGVFATVATTCVLAWLVRVGLRPVDRIARDISEIDERQLTRRFDGLHAPRELRPITDRLNSLLERLDAAFVREKAMTADVAHELRTPLAGLRSTLEVALSREREGASYREALSDCLAISVRMQRLVEYLLSLAKLDAGREAMTRQPTAIRTLLDSAWKPLLPAEAQKRLIVKWAVENDLVVETDPEKLGTVMKNVFENAVHYVDTGGTVSIEAMRQDGNVLITVANTGSRLTREQVSHVFERFWRGDAARESPGTHCGLGLSLCKTIVEQLGGTIAATSTREGTFSIVLKL